MKKNGAHPNILVILSDDHAQWAAHCYGNSELRTPNMDWLAARGVRMVNAFTTCPVCSPARASFLTGRLPSQHGIHDYLSERDDKDWLANETTLGEILQEHGYRTGLVGKWHCGRSHFPHRGFDYWCSFDHSKGILHRGSHTSYFYEQGTPLAFCGHTAAFFAEKAVEFVRSTPAERPLFLCVGFVDTHHPFGNHPERLVESYRSCRFDDIPRESSVKRPGWIRRRCTVPADPLEQRELLAQYYAAVTFIDEQVGRLLDELEGSGRLENTLVIYTADHGHMNGHHGIYFKGNATVPQNFYEEAIRVPCLLYGKGLIREGQTYLPMVDHCDLFQTLLDAARIPMSEGVKEKIHSPGQSYLALLRGKSLAWRSYVYLEYGNARMIRSERYKLIRRYQPHAGAFPDEFYDLEKDPRECENRVNDTDCSGTIALLGKELEKHFAAYEVPGYSARNIENQSPCNPFEPWRIKNCGEDAP